MRRNSPIDRASQHPDARRLVVELRSLYVACDDCGHSRLLRLDNLRRASEAGAHSYYDLCHKIRCGECPPMLPEERNLTIRPTWFDEEAAIQTVA